MLGMVQDDRIVAADTELASYPNCSLRRAQCSDGLENCLPHLGDLIANSDRKGRDSIVIEQTKNRITNPLIVNDPSLQN
jgi:hypothetical protein